MENLEKRTELPSSGKLEVNCEYILPLTEYELDIWVPDEENNPLRLSLIDIRGSDDVELKALISKGCEYALVNPLTRSIKVTDPGYRAGASGVYGIRMGEEVKIGRDNETMERAFSFSKKASRNQATLMIDRVGDVDTIRIIDGGSLRGTKIDYKKVS